MTTGRGPRLFFALWPDARAAVATAPCPPEAAQLATALRTLSRGLGLTPDERPLRPHITLVLAQSREGSVAPAVRYAQRARWRLAG